MQHTRTPGPSPDRWVPVVFTGFLQSYLHHRDSRNTSKIAEGREMFGCSVYDRHETRAAIIAQLQMSRAVLCIMSCSFVADIHKRKAMRLSGM